MPFFHGIGGAGAVPFAMMMEPSLCAATTVFRLIAPTKTSMDRAVTASMRDIMPPGVDTTPDALYPVQQECQVSRNTNLLKIGVQLPGLLPARVSWTVRAGVLRPQ